MMAFRTPRLPVWLALPACALLGACQSDPEISHHAAIPVAVAATPTVNPNPDGQPAPIVARVYQLASKDRFLVADPMQLILHDAQTLGEDNLGRDELILEPGTKRSLTLPGNDKVHFVGIVAAYRAIDRNDWRQLVAVPDGDQVLTLDVTLGTGGIRIEQAVAQGRK
ncbi:MAG: type VI secretion system lipoprotein TssJ [Telmatospirillum sp.]|nr:type VI secretion system lipoprotein TssJ [Telmatospirillum sp.]